MESHVDRRRVEGVVGGGRLLLQQRGESWIGLGIAGIDPRAAGRQPVVVIVKLEPVFEQEPALEKLTDPPGALAATEKLELYAAEPGACVVTVIVWLAFCAVTDSVTSGAAL